MARMPEVRARNAHPAVRLRPRQIDLAIVRQRDRPTSDAEQLQIGARREALQERTAGNVLFQQRVLECSCRPFALEARQVQLPYLALAGVLVLVALLVAVTRFPASGARASASGKPTLAGVFAHRSFVWAIVAQFFYVGAQIGVWSYFIDFTKELTPLTPEKTCLLYTSDAADE